VDARVEVNARLFAAAGLPQQRKLRELAARLRREVYLGEKIPANRIPKQFQPADNLFRLELPEGWRALYTVATRRGFPPVVRVVWIGDHQRYDRLFGYRRS
jgi:hypothetical protein